VTVVGLQASPERFPLARRVLADLDFTGLAHHPQTYIVVASHGNYDEEALAWALNTEAAYVALVASPRRAEEVRAYLREAGLTPERLARLKCPAGLDLGAVTPEEIALSVLAEIVQLRRRTTDDRRLGAAIDAGPLRGKTDEGQRSTFDSHHASPATPPEPATAIDPVCHMTVEIAGARYVTEHAGQSYYFCCAGCQRRFEQEPGRYLS
jgi:xanthine dehydrogenase accessory factor